MTRERFVLGALLAAALALPAVVRSPYVLHVAVLAGIYVILTLSLNLVTGFCGQFSLGHAGFYGVILLGLILFRTQGLLGGISLGLTRRPASPA